jgi:undecaprenyl diphosphate synthase
MLKHITIIPDGNRRWAKERGLPSLEGHRRGYDKVKDIGEWCVARGIPFLTVWGFSTENWKRSEEEVNYLMDLIHLALTKEIGFYNEKGIRVKVMGLRDGLPEKVLLAIEEAEMRTAGNAKGQINLCINYGGHAEIVAAAKKLIAEGRTADEITEETFGAATWFSGIPEPDLIIRTSGEQRLSGFLSWSGAYSEMLFIEKHFPDFSESDLDAAIAEFDRRERRFGK